MAGMYDEYEFEKLPDGSTMLTHFLGVRSVLMQRRVNYPSGSEIAWGREFDPGPDGPEAVDSPVRACQRDMRADPAAFDRRPVSGVRLADSETMVGSAW